MGRIQAPLYCHPESKIYFARWYQNSKRVMLSTGTPDLFEANRRLPIIRQSGLSWSDYQRSIQGMGSMVVNALGEHRITPPLTFSTAPDSMAKMIEEAIRTGNAFYDAERGYWILKALRDGLPTDSTAMPERLNTTVNLFQGVNQLTTTFPILDDFSAIEKFYNEVIPQIFIDKTTARLFGRIWLDFLREKKIANWLKIDEKLCIDFKEWRKVTPIQRGKGNCARAPSGKTVNAHIDYLRRSFDEAIARGYLRVNPVRNWAPEPHTTPTKKPLTLEELKKVLSMQVSPYLEIILLLFVAVKRRKEILQLKIEDLCFEEHWAYYKEYKNSSKGREYSIDKAFWITPPMEALLRRVIGNRTEGLIFPDIYDDTVSWKFEQAVDTVAKEKKLTLRNLRQTASDILEKSGLSDEEINYCLGHYSVKGSLRNYKDMSRETVARRLSALTKKGIEVLTEAVKEFLK
jgi:integrase